MTPPGSMTAGTIRPGGCCRKPCRRQIGIGRQSPCSRDRHACRGDDPQLPALNGPVNTDLPRSIEECLDCAQTCTSCADACLGEAHFAELRQCIRLNLDCADLCAATAAIASRRTGANDAVLKAVLLACREACRACGAECGRHASMHEHCQVCADACRRCEEACMAAAEGITSSLQ